MVGSLLLRGMLIGVVAGLVAFVFAYTIGEPLVDYAIAFEEQQAAAETGAAGSEAMEAEADEPELVTRGEQATIGLVTGLVGYGAAVGGLFALVFAFAYGRVGRFGVRATSVLLALAAFVAVVLVPQIKYPANPPAVGSPETIGIRTGLFFIMLVLSLAAMAAAVMLARRLWASHGGWNATLIAGAAFLVFIAIVQFAMPTINEVPENFSADVLWRFRLSSIGIHVILWTVIGLAFGAFAERQVGDSSGLRLAGSHR
ncbi:MAG: CbtA family protein [Mesorhizobium sp.]